MELFIRRINGLYINAKAYADYCNKLGIRKSSSKYCDTNIHGISLSGADTVLFEKEYYFQVASLKKVISKLKNNKASVANGKRYKNYRMAHRGEYLEKALNHFLEEDKMALNGKSRMGKVSKEMKKAVQEYHEQMLIEDDGVIQFNYAA